MAKKRQIILTRTDGAGGGMAPLGSVREVLDALADFNTAPDGGPKRSTGTDFLHGPGFVVEIPSTQATVTQAIVTMTDEDIAWPVLVRLTKRLGWTMVDLETGRSFGSR